MLEDVVEPIDRRLAVGCLANLKISSSPRRVLCSMGWKGRNSSSSMREKDLVVETRSTVSCRVWGSEEAIEGYTQRERTQCRERSEWKIMSVQSTARPMDAVIVAQEERQPAAAC